MIVTHVKLCLAADLVADIDVVSPLGSPHVVNWGRKNRGNKKTDTGQT